MNEDLINVFYIIASILFIFGIKMLGSAATARKGNLISSLGMLLAICATLASGGLDPKWIVLGMVLGSVIGAAAARMVAMTAMPEMVALFNGFGGISSLLLGWAEYHSNLPETTIGKLAQDAIEAATGEDPLALGTRLAIGFAVLVGGITFTGSMIAWGKLSEKMSSKPYTFSGQGILNAILFVGALVLIGIFSFSSQPGQVYNIFIALVILSLLLGVMAVIPIGGGDMPVVISLLNSYSGIAACAAGFIISNNVLIVAGALVGASGLILTAIMCKAMNRSLSNVLFSGFGSAGGSGGKAVEGEAKPISAPDAYFVLEAASSVLFVPGYGMAVAQAQHAVRELANILRDNGAEVRFAVHPVAGRMPGHMNVLLAEANVDYDQLVEPDDVNPTMGNEDVVVVIGANDVVNPAARDDDTSAIYGMPIIEVDRAKTVFVLKRSMRSGFAGIENPLFFKDNTRMLFGDAKASISALIEEFKG